MITQLLGEHGAVLAELNPHSADGLRDTVLGIVAAIGVAVMAVSMLVKVGEQRYGQMIGLALGASMVFTVVAAPDVVFDVLAGLGSSIVGGRS